MYVERNFSPLKIFVSSKDEQEILKEILMVYIDKYTPGFYNPKPSDKKKASLMVAQQLYKALENN